MKSNKISKSMMNKKGMWMQVFLISFFVILVIFCLILLALSVNSGNLNSKRQYIDEDLKTQEAQISLIGLLRTPVVIDGKTLRLADAIAMNGDGKYDDIIINNLKLNLKSIGICGVSIKSTNQLQIESKIKPEFTNLLQVLYKTTMILPGSNGNIDITLTRYNVTEDKWTGEYIVSKSVIQSDSTTQPQTDTKSSTTQQNILKPCTASVLGGMKTVKNGVCTSTNVGYQTCIHSSQSTIKDCGDNYVGYCCQT